MCGGKPRRRRGEVYLVAVRRVGIGGGGAGGGPGQPPLLWKAPSNDGPRVAIHLHSRFGDNERTIKMNRIRIREWVHANICVRNLARTVPFYEMLGFEKFDDNFFEQGSGGWEGLGIPDGRRF